MRPGPQAATALRIGPAGLALGEQLVLAGLRGWARARLSGDEPRLLVDAGLTHVASRPVAQVFAAMMRQVERQAVRAMQVHCVACPGYSEDEQRIVLACGLARTSPWLTCRLLHPLVRAPEKPALLAGALNVALENSGYRLPVRRVFDAEGPATLH